MIAELGKLLLDIQAGRPVETRITNIYLGTDAYREFKEEIEAVTAVTIRGTFDYQGVEVKYIDYPKNAVRVIVEYCLK